MPILSIDQIDGANDRPVLVVPVSEWGGEVRVRGLSPDQLGSARAKAWHAAKKQTDDTVLSAWFLVEGIVEPKPTFAVATRWLKERAFGPVNRILAEILGATGLGGKAQAEAKSEVDD